jgi:hypothetical protein
MHIIDSTIERKCDMSDIFVSRQIDATCSSRPTLNGVPILKIKDISPVKLSAIFDTNSSVERERYTDRVSFKLRSGFIILRSHMAHGCRLPPPRYVAYHHPLAAPPLQYISRVRRYQSIPSSLVKFSRCDELLAASTLKHIEPSTTNEY